MSDLNTVQLFGRVVQNAQLKNTANGLKVAVFTIATNRSFKNSDGSFTKQGEFFPLAIYGSYAEKMFPHLTKGQKVIVEGFLKREKWEKDGEKRSTISIGVRALHLIWDSKKAGSSENQASPQGDISSGTENFDTDSFDLTAEELSEMYADENEDSAEEAIF